MKLGVTKIFCGVVIAFLIVALGSTAQTPKPQGCNDPPWFNTEGKCNLKQRTFIFAGGVGWPKRNEKDCYLYIHVCSFRLNRKTIVPLVGTKCPEPDDFAQPTFCCDEFNKAVKTKKPCDPMRDVDCDGLPNLPGKIATGGGTIRSVEFLLRTRLMTPQSTFLTRTGMTSVSSLHLTCTRPT